jgi:hypothetical protein
MRQAIVVPEARKQSSRSTPLTDLQILTPANPHMIWHTEDGSPLALGDSLLRQSQFVSSTGIENPGLP